MYKDIVFNTLQLWIYSILVYQLIFWKDMIIIHFEVEF